MLLRGLFRLVSLRSLLHDGHDTAGRKHSEFLRDTPCPWRLMVFFAVPPGSAGSGMRRIRRCGRIHVDVKPLRCFGPRRITVPVMAVVRALRGNIFATRGLCKLPDFGESDSALRRTWRSLRKHASRRGWAGIVD